MASRPWNSSQLIRLLGKYIVALACMTVVAGPQLGDLDADGRDDILLRAADNGSWIYYAVDESRAVLQRIVGATKNLDYRLVGIGNFNDQNGEEVLLRHTENGSWIYYVIAGDGYATLHRVTGVTRNLEYVVAGVGDLDGDEHSEIVLRHAENGNWISYSFDGERAQLRHLTGVTTNLDYRIRAVADLDGDGVDDLVLRHTTSGAWIYYVTDGRRAVLRRITGATTNLDYLFAGIGDLDGDRRYNNLLLRHRDNGQWISYRIDGTRASLENLTGVTSNQSYQLVGVGNLDADRADEVLLRHGMTGTWIYYDVLGPRGTLHRITGATTNLTWQIAGMLAEINRPPVADPGPDLEADERNLVVLDGSGSSDPDGRIVSYLWESVRGPAVELSRADGPIASFTLPNLVENTYFIFRLTVIDDDGAVAAALVVIRGLATADDTTFTGRGEADPDGGDIEAGDLTIMIPADAILKPIEIEVMEAELPMGLPSGLRQVDEAFEIQVSEADQDQINGPFKIRVAYDDAEMSQDQILLPLHFEGGQYKPVRILSIDSDMDTITFESRSFSTFVLTTFDASLPQGYQTNFAPRTHGWQIRNQGNIYFTSNGNCLGMSGYAVWYYNNRTDGLYGGFSDEVAQLVATRAQLAQSQTWAHRQWQVEQALPEAVLIRTMKGYLQFLQAPLILLMRESGGPGGHASVVYGYDETGFLFYDVNVPRQSQRLSYDDGFGTYDGYDSFGFVAVASLGRNEDFLALTEQAASGFVTSDEISVTSPRQGEVVASRETTVSGTLDQGLVGRGGELVLTVKGGEPRIVPVGTNGSFSEALEVSNGTNTLVFLAGVDIDNQSNWYTNAATLIRTFQGDVPVAHLLATLTWDQDGTDVDLYITEPAGESMWYGSRTTSNGLTLDFDDRNGFGPEHGTLNETGTILDGLYRVRVHYYSDYGSAVQASGRVSIVLREGLGDQLVDTIPFSISSDDAGMAGPDGSGASWSEIANVDVVGGRIVRTGAPPGVILKVFRLGGEK